MFFSRFSITRPIFTAMLLVALFLFGTIGFQRMGLDLYPKVEFPVITITSILPGADPEIVEMQVTDPIEEALSSLSGIHSLRSKSKESVSQIVLEFELEKNVDIAYQEVQAKIGAIRSHLPADLIAPVVDKFDFDSIPIITIMIFGTMPIEELSSLVDKEVKRPLQRVANVGQIQTVGAREKKMWLLIDRDLLEAHKLTLQDIEQSLKTHHLKFPAGRLEEGPSEKAVKISAEFQTAEEFSQLTIATRNGVPLRVKDVGRVIEGIEEERSSASFNEKNAIALLVRRQSGSNTVEVADAVKKECARIKESLSKKNISIEPVQDLSFFIKRSIHEVYFHLIFGGGLAILIVLLFLRNLRSTLICALALPTAVVGTFYFMYLLGFTQNVMTLLALSIAIGLLIDDAIVVQENIIHHLEKGLSPKNASLQGASQIAAAVLATTLCVAAVFVPVAFMKGMIGRFFYQFGLTISFAILTSLFISFTLNPSFSAQFLKEIPRGNFYYWIEKVLKGLEKLYSVLLNKALHHRGWIVSGALLLFVFSLFLSKYLPMEFMPQEDRSEFSIRIEAPEGSSHAYTQKALAEVRQLLNQQPWLLFTISNIGADAFQNVALGNLYVRMVDKEKRTLSQEAAMEETRDLLSKFTKGTVIVEHFVKVGGGSKGNADLQLEIRGPSLTTLSHLSTQMMEVLNTTPGYRDLYSSFESQRPQIEIQIKREMASDLGISPLAIATTVKTAVGGNTVAKFCKEGDYYDVILRLADPFRKEISQLSLLSVRNAQGDLVSLQNLIHAAETQAPTEIDRYNRTRQITLSANLDRSKKVLGDAIKEIGAYFSKHPLPEGYTYGFSGSAKIFQESFQNLFFALLMAIFIVYMVLAAQFESLLDPMIIMISLPLSLIGSLGALLIFGKTMTIFTMIGLIMLMGLVTKNGILLVDVINTLYRKEHMSRQEALIEGGKRRLRPILMTTLSIIFGMLPIALSVGAGSQAQAPMALAVIGGLITSTLLTLVVVPVIYTFVDDRRKKKAPINEKNLTG